jgi:hypothetical protein
MNLDNEIVIHKVFGEGSILQLEGDKLTVAFISGEKKFKFPDAFNGFLMAKNPKISEQIQECIKEYERVKQKELQEKQNAAAIERQLYTEQKEFRSPRKSVKNIQRANIAFKCNFCDGGQSDEQIGFNGVCSDDLIHNNIVIEKRTWCNSEDCPCLHYHSGDMTREELDSMCKDDGFVCYESQMLREWKTMAGIVQNGENKGKPMKLNQVQTNSLYVLTTRDPRSKEEDRYIFAVFLVDDTYEGDGRDEGYVSTTSEYKIKLNPTEAHFLLFWNYHVNDNQPEVAVWSSGLHRYFEDEQAVQILRNIAKIKKGTDVEVLSERFLQHFCRINGVNLSTVKGLSRALKK